VYDFLGYPLPAEQVERIYEQFKIRNIKAGNMPRVLVHPAQQTGAKGGKPSPAPGADRSGTTPTAAEDAAPRAALKLLEGFFRTGQAGGWRDSLTEEQVASVERIAGPLMRELGYAPLLSTEAGLAALARR
jgi:hypothetical protein